MTDKTFIALTLDHTIAWFGHEKRVAHVVWSDIVRPGGDFLSREKLPTACGSILAVSSESGTAERYQGDRKCRKCEKWAQGPGGENATLDTLAAWHVEENGPTAADIIKSDPTVTVITIDTVKGKIRRDKRDEKLAETLSDGHDKVTDPQTETIGGRFGFLLPGEFEKLTRTQQRRYWRQVDTNRKRAERARAL